MQIYSKCIYFGLNYWSKLVIKQYLHQNFNINWFLILAAGQSLFHRATLEATFLESLELSLCRQKEFLYELKLFRLRRK